ncbi:MAG: hypothetical protein DMG38_11545 [Acidobacteria bacterium]|nr:MAG: hypothetical protein DMG38_11545 [Acidobacteriota bacterium]
MTGGAEKKEKRPLRESGTEIRRAESSDDKSEIQIGKRMGYTPAVFLTVANKGLTSRHCFRKPRKSAGRVV